MRLKTWFDKGFFMYAEVWNKSIQFHSNPSCNQFGKLLHISNEDHLGLLHVFDKIFYFFKHLRLLSMHIYHGKSEASGPLKACNVQ
jgi:hypothetical protein